MNSLLPNGYIFTKSKVITPDRINYPYFLGQPAGKLLVISITSIIIALILIYICLKIDKKTKNKIIENILNFVTLLSFIPLATGTFLLIAWIAIDSKNIQASFRQGVTGTNFNEPLVHPYALDCDFKFKPHSNLVIRQVARKPLLTHNNQKKHDYALYYKLNDQHASYLGQTQNHKFKFVNSGNRDNLFLQKYFAYIKDKHLENKFKNTMYLEPYSDITADSKDTQYQLRGDHITLKLSPSRKVHIYQTNS